MGQFGKNILKVVMLTSLIPASALVVKLGLIITLPLVTKLAIAKDFGVVGHIYQIEEQDIIQYIQSRLKTFDIDYLKKEYQQRVVDTVNRPKEVNGISNALKTRQYYYDPTFILREDIKNHEGVVIYASGTKINPLESTSLDQDLVFIDGDNEAQIRYALDYKSSKSHKIILVKGSPIGLQKRYKRWIYFDQDGVLVKKLGIKHVPAIVTQDKLRLAITELNLEDVD